MIHAFLTRKTTSAVGTFGELVTETPGGEQFRCFTAELPWRDNVPRASCIPAGTYRCEPYQSSTKGRVYIVHRVPGRRGILIHAGNWAGDVALGLRSNIQGCILVGSDVRPIYGQMAVTDSRITLDRFHRAMRWEPFDLEIVEAYK